MSRKNELRYEDSIQKRIAAQLPTFDDIQSQMTYTERLSDTVSYIYIYMFEYQIIGIPIRHLV